MVLKNSKWDKKAKHSYMKKHGISGPKKDNTPKPKWSSKNVEASKHPGRIVLEDSDSEWDSDTDDALLNHFYPQLGETELTKEQKLKIRQQILAQIDQEESGETQEPVAMPQEVDGIYLGSSINEEIEMSAPPSDNKINLREILAKSSQPGKSRKTLKAKMTDNFLDEYGLDSYQDLNRNKDDYNGLHSKKNPVDLMHLPSDQLDGFVIGTRIQTDQKPQTRRLTEEEIQENKRREEKAQQSRMYDEIRSRFNPNASVPKSRVLDLNNYDSNNESHVSALNDKIAASSNQEAEYSMDDDLDFLLGGSLKASHGEVLDPVGPSKSIEDLLQNLKVSKPDEPQRKVTQPTPAPSDVDFLDGLLGN